MDRHDLQAMGAMLAASAAIGLNLVYLQADAVAGAANGRLVLIPVCAGLAVAASGFVEHLRRRGRDMVLVGRVWIGSLLYLALSAGLSAAFQPRPD